MHGFATATVARKPDPLTKFDDFDGADPHRIATSGQLSIPVPSLITANGFPVTILIAPNIRGEHEEF